MCKVVFVSINNNIWPRSLISSPLATGMPVPSDRLFYFILLKIHRLWRIEGCLTAVEARPLQLNRLRFLHQHRRDVLSVRKERKKGKKSDRVGKIEGSYLTEAVIISY